MKILQLSELKNAINVFYKSAKTLQNSFLLDTIINAYRLKKIYNIEKAANIDLTKKYSPEKTKQILALLNYASKGNNQLISYVKKSIDKAETAVNNVNALSIKPELCFDTLISNIMHAPKEVQKAAKLNFKKANHYAGILVKQMPQYQDKILPEMKRILIKQTAVQQRLDLKLKNLSASQAKAPGIEL